MEPAVAADPNIVINDSVVRLVKGDITELEVDAFVFYAQPNLALGSGFGGMIAVRGGPSVQKELDGMAEAGPLETGQAVVSAAGRLEADWIIHGVGPRFREDGIDEKLHATMEACLAVAEEKEITTLAFPAMGAGYYGIPAPDSARVMFQALREHLTGKTGLKEIVICVLDTPQFKAFDAALAALN
jgi:O-acetyl-ADP-ribose deacetylase (regulator of RNase III)